MDSIESAISKEISEIKKEVRDAIKLTASFLEAFKKSQAKQPQVKISEIIEQNNFSLK
jgi:hypothetical protein